MEEKINTMKRENTINDRLQQECQLLKVAMGECQGPIPKGKMKTTIEIMQNAGTSLSSLAIMGTDQIFTTLCQRLQKLDNSRNMKTLFKQTMLFAFLNLSESYIKQRLHIDAVRVLSFADQYYQSCDKQGANMHNYRQRFVVVFKQILQVHANKKSDKSIYNDLYGCAKEFEACALTALPLMKKDKTGKEQLYHAVSKSADRTDLEKHKQIIINSRMQRSLSSQSPIDSVCEPISFWTGISPVKLSTEEHVYQLEAFILVCKNNVTVFQKDRFSWKKYALLKALPSMRLYVECYNVDRNELRIFQQRCESLVNVSFKNADVRLSLLQLQLTLSVSVMYSENEVKKPQFTLKAFRDAIKLYQSIADLNVMQKSDYERFVKSILMINCDQFTTKEDLTSFKQCIQTVWVMIEGQKGLQQYQEGLGNRMMDAAKRVHKTKVKTAPLPAATALPQPQTPVPTNTDTVAAVIDAGYSSVANLAFSWWQKIPSLGGDVDEDFTDATELTNLNSKKTVKYASVTFFL